MRVCILFAMSPVEMPHIPIVNRNMCIKALVLADLISTWCTTAEAVVASIEVQHWCTKMSD